jgi:hypothetical protein
MREFLILTIHLLVVHHNEYSLLRNPGVLCAIVHTEQHCWWEHQAAAQNPTQLQRDHGETNSYIYYCISYDHCACHCCGDHRTSRESSRRRSGLHASQWSGLHSRESSRAAADSSSAGRGRRSHSCAADHYRAGRPHRHYAGATGTTLGHHLAPTLSGNAKSKAEADKAVKIARDTKGVSSVKNEIKVQAK